jgi:hypothetical protein
LDAISLVYVPIALLAGFVLHRALFRSRDSVSKTPQLSRWAAILLPLTCLFVWVGLCYGFKLLTWKAFAGDARGSVALTSLLLLTGSAMVGAWIAARLK